jgi:SpoVK/Ycf46/Vps4 family AAA+-type ATPase
MVERYNSDKSQFLFDFNIRDKVFIVTDPRPSANKEPALPQITEYLTNSLIKSSKFDLILSYSLTTGIQLLSDVADKPIDIGWSGMSQEQDKNKYRLKLYENISEKAIATPELLEQIGQPTPETLPYDRDPMRAFMFLDRLLTRQFTLPRTEKGLKDNGEERKRTVRLALIVDYLENLSPASQVGHRDQVLLAETLSRWAKSEAIRLNGHLIVLLAEDINQVSPALYAGAAGTVNIRIERPDLAQRLAYLNWMSADYSHQWNLQNLASITAGFNIAEIQDLITFAKENNDGRLDNALIKQRKRDVIRSESRNLLEFVDTEDVSFDHVGGLEHVKQALRDISTWLHSEETSRLVPKGILFVGPPGTGKSLVAQALARESGINMVKLRDVQSMWVGESERNMSRVLDVARAFAPVIIFVDEIDQAYGQRSGGDSTGVSSRLFGKLLEFMGDNANRGKVLWVAASNRPDFVDAALISRFDRVIPFLLPDRANREEILLHAMPKIVKLEWIDGSEVASWPSESQTIWNQLLDLTEEFSGRELELILRRGIELADGRRLIPSCVLEAVQKFEHSHDRDVYQLQTLLALQVTNFKDYLPDPESLSPRDLAEKITSQVEGQSIIDRGKVQESIAKLRRRIR